MTGVLYRLARFSVRYRFAVLAVWVLLAVALVGVAHHLGDNTNDNVTLPGTDSQQAAGVLSGSFPGQANGSSPIVLHVASGKLTDATYSQAVGQAAAGVAKAPDVASVVSPLTAQGASALSKDQKTGYLSVSPGAMSVADAQTIINAAAGPARAAGIQVETGGQLGQKGSKPATEDSELIGIVAAMVILTVTFGTVVAMLVPIVTAILGLAATLSIIVRCLLVPARMARLGTTNWYLPRWLGHILPRLNIEGQEYFNPPGQAPPVTQLQAQQASTTAS